MQLSRGTPELLGVWVAGNLPEELTFELRRECGEDPREHLGPVLAGALGVVVEKGQGIFRAEGSK